MRNQSYAGLTAPPPPSVSPKPSFPPGLTAGGPTSSSSPLPHGHSLPSVSAATLLSSSTTENNNSILGFTGNIFLLVKIKILIVLREKSFRSWKENEVAGFVVFSQLLFSYV